jgi:hypothetical protein
MPDLNFHFIIIYNKNIMNWIILLLININLLLLQLYFI